MSVRNACAADAELLVRLHHAAVHEAARHDYPQDVLDAWSPPPDERRFAWMRGQIAAGKNRVLVAAAPDGSVTGFCMFSTTDGWIQAVYVTPARSGSGIGRRLLRMAEQEIAARDGCSARLNASQNALRFYLREGYVVVRATTQALADGTRMDCLEMHKDLSRAGARLP